MAIVLILMLIAAARKREAYLIAAMGVHVFNMVAPRLFRPAAVVWFGLSHILGAVASKVLLAVAFFAVVTPVGFWRRFSGVDSLRLKSFKSGHGSVMHVRDHEFTGRDIEQPY
jgi:hypothetical protein